MATKKPKKDTSFADLVARLNAMSNVTKEDERASLMEAANQEPRILDDKEVSLADIARLAGIKEFDAEQKVRSLDREVGPIKYLAQLIYGNDEREVLDQAIRLFILLLVFVFDPLAVMLVIAANQTLLRYGINLESSGPPVPPMPPKEPEPGPDPEPEDIEEWFDSHFEEDSRELYGDNMPDIEEITDKDYLPPISLQSAVDDAADVMSDYNGRDKTFFESINEPAIPEVKNVDTQSTTDIVEQISQTDKSEQDLNMILKGKTKSQLLLMAEDGGIEIPAQLSKAEIVANIIANYDSITKKKI